MRKYLRQKKKKMAAVYKKKISTIINRRISSSRQVFINKKFYLHFTKTKKGFRNEMEENCETKNGMLNTGNGRNPKIMFQSPTFDESSTEIQSEHSTIKDDSNLGDLTNNEVSVSSYRGPPVYQTSVSYDEDCDVVKIRENMEKRKNDLKDCENGIWDLNYLGKYFFEKNCGE